MLATESTKEALRPASLSTIAAPSSVVCTTECRTSSSRKDKPLRSSPANLILARTNRVFQQHLLLFRVPPISARQQACKKNTLVLGSRASPESVCTLHKAKDLDLKLVNTHLRFTLTNLSTLLCKNLLKEVTSHVFSFLNSDPSHRSLSCKYTVIRSNEFTDERLNSCGTLRNRTPHTWV